MLRRRFALLAASAAGLALSGCASLLTPNTVTLTQAEIESLLERNFPVERGLLDIFDVTVNAPRIELLPERNRLAAVIDVRARNRLLGIGWQARMHFDAALRWETRDKTLRLAQVRVQDLALVDPGAASRNTVERLGAAMAERVLEDSPIYRLSAARAEKLRQRGVEPGAVTVTSRGVEITFTPLPANAPVPASR